MTNIKPVLRIDSLLSDNSIQFFGNGYYTCIKDTDTSHYDCIEGSFDTTYSNNTYNENEWKKVSIPFILPKRFHIPYLVMKYNTKSITIHTPNNYTH